MPQRVVVYWKTPQRVVLMGKTQSVPSWLHAFLWTHCGNLCIWFEISAKSAENPHGSVWKSARPSQMCEDIREPLQATAYATDFRATGVQFYVSDRWRHSLMRPDVDLNALLMAVAANVSSSTRTRCGHLVSLKYLPERIVGFFVFQIAHNVILQTINVQKKPTMRSVYFLVLATRFGKF